MFQYFSTILYNNIMYTLEILAREGNLLQGWERNLCAPHPLNKSQAADIVALCTCMYMWICCLNL